ncbi:MAG: hypothetical protein K2L16_07090 [Muribaculaceae bacterium]|nr:hypothetical protein [Muribaculaceae bacterium]
MEHKSTHSEPTRAEIDRAEQNHPGVAVDRADDGKATPRLVRERTKTLNNNPRNND